MVERKSSGSHRYDSAVDLWAAGVILYTLLTGSMPFHNKDQSKLFHQIATASYSVTGKRWEAVTPQAKAIVKGLLCVEPGKRLTATQALESEWVLMANDMLGVALEHAQEELRNYAQQLALPVRFFRDGAIIVRQGECNPEVFLIRRGCVDVFVEDKFQGRDGPTTVVPLGQCFEGDYIGEFSLFETDSGASILPPLRGAQLALPEHPAAELAGSSPAAGAEGAASSKPPKATLSSLSRTTFKMSSVMRADAVPPCPISVRAVNDVEVIAFTRQQLKAKLDHDKGMNLAVLKEAEERFALLERRHREALEQALGIGSHGIAGDSASAQHGGPPVPAGHGKMVTPGRQGADHFGTMVRRPSYEMRASSGSSHDDQKRFSGGAFRDGSSGHASPSPARGSGHERHSAIADLRGDKPGTVLSQSVVRELHPG